MDYQRSMAESYDTLYGALRDPSGDREFYRTLAKSSGGPVLEIGCGTGRVLLPIARDGIAITGVDPSEEMLTVLRSKSPPQGVSLVRATAQTLSLPERDYKLCFFAFRAFQHLETVEDQLRALSNIRDHLAPGGLLALDVFEPSLARMAIEEEPESADGDPFEIAGRPGIRRLSIRRDRATQTMQITFRYLWADTGEEFGVEPIRLRWFYRYELEHLLVRAGFSPEAWYSDYRGRPYDGKGEIIVVARRT